MNAGDLVQYGGAIGELPLVTAHSRDGGQVRFLEHGQDLLDAERVVACKRLTSA
jgi:hypothetical protein